MLGAHRLVSPVQEQYGTPGPNLGVQCRAEPHEFICTNTIPLGLR